MTPPPLTPRELAVLGLVADGYTSSEIAELLVVHPETVKAAREAIMTKLEARNAAHMVATAFKEGLLT